MIDLEQIHLWWKLFHRDGAPMEVRMIKSDKLNASGYYKNLDNIIRDVDYYDKKDGWQIYFVLNEIDDACYSRRQCERAIENATATTDDNIKARRWVFIDLDPKRPKEVSSSNEQLEKARVKANQIYKFLQQQGFENMVAALSGNGFHVQIPCSLDNNKENKALVEHFLEAIRMLFEDDDIEVDQKPKNAARLCKLYGTTAKKGVSTDDRPHRLSKILRYPESYLHVELKDRKANKREYFEKVAALYKKEKPEPSRENNFGRTPFDVESFLSRHGIGYKKKIVADGTRYLLDECPFHPEHKSPDSMVFQNINGAISFYCFHNSCNDYKWKDLRLMYEPDAYDQKDYGEYKYKRKYYDRYEPKPVEIKEENKDDGKKWLCLGDINVVREEDLIVIPTGIHQLDKRMRGFILGETTILSGINASGKTSLINTLLLNAVNKGFPSALWSGELQASRLKSWICQAAAGKTYVQKIEGYDCVYEPKPSVYEPIEQWLENKLFIYNNNYGSNYNQLITDITELIDTKGVKLVCLDNLMAMSLDEIAGDKNDKQKQLILALAELARKKNVHILVVAHPRKEASLTLLRKESVSGSSDLTNVVHNLLLIHRVGKDFEKRASEFWGKEKVAELITYDNIVEIAKNRTYGYVDVCIGLYYEEQTRRFKNNISEYTHYGWEPDVVYTYTPPQQLQPNTTFDTQAQQVQQPVRMNDENGDLFNTNTAYEESHRNDTEDPF